MKLQRQAQAAECGLACLAMVADHFGHRTDLAELRQRFGLSARGASLSRLIAIAGAIGLQPRALRLEPDDLARLRLPCVLHWDLNHFVVLAAVRRGRARVFDPGGHDDWVDAAEVGRRFTGVALELQPGAEFVPCPPPPAIGWRQLAGRVHGLLPVLGSVLVLSLALQLFVLLAPFYLQWTIDHALLSADADLLALLALAFAGLLALQVATSALRGWTLLHLTARLGSQWAGNVFAHLMRLPVAFFERRQLADVVSRMGSVQALQRGLTTGAVEAVVDGLTAAATLAMMLAYAPGLAALSVAVLAAYLGARLAGLPALRRATERQLAATASQHGHLLESLRGMASLKVAGLESARTAAQANLRGDTVNAELRVGRFGLGWSTAGQALFGGERVLAIWLAARGVLDGALTVGMLVAYLAYRDQFAARVGGLVDRILEFRMLRRNAERPPAIVLASPEAEVAAPALHGRDGEIGLVVDGFGFRHADGEPWVLRGCGFRIAPGECVAIAGVSGSGKTTLVKLLLGLAAPTEGEVRIDGVPLPRHGLRAHRSQVGAVMQDDLLFAGTLADNIALGDAEPDPAAIEAAARLAAVHDDIAAMPMGYQTLVGDMGSSLSGGQKQRVLLARALYRQPRLLILDEATSHLDLARERAVNAAVRALDITRIVVAHRPETIASADRVLVLDGGRIVADRRIAPATAAGNSGEPAAAV
jgi:ATP-binding cassette subfamily B protein RaxB